MIDLSNVIALALGSDDVLQIQDAIGTVLWQKIIYYNVNISAGSNGTVSVNGVSGNYSQSVPSGTVLTIEGTGNTGYDFDEWSDGNTDNPRTITVTGDLTLTAAFESAAPLPSYFYVEDISGADNTLSIKKSSSNAPTIEVFKSTDGTNWSSMGNTDTTAITATVPANSKLYLKAVADRWGTGNSNYNDISMVSYFNVGGNTMSLLYGDNFENQTTFPTANNNVFPNLFKNTQVVSAADLELPATTLVNYCYYGMFRDCSALTTAPVTLPATTLVDYCYQYMFQGSSALTTAPVLPATTLTYYCYGNMFDGCTSLTTAPALPATTLVLGCYNNMFYGCSSLNTVTTYADDISASVCLTNWLYGVSATGDFYNFGGATYQTDSASGIPTGWTEHTPVVYNDMILQFAGGGNTTILGSNANISDFDEVYYYDTNDVKTTINNKTVDFTGLTNVNVYYKLKQLAFTATQLDNALPNGNYYGMPVQSFYNVPITKIIQFDSNTEVIPSSVFRGSSNISLECELPDSVLSVGNDSFNAPMTLLNTSRFVFGTHCGYIGKYVLESTKSNMTHILVRCNMTDNGVDSWFNSYARFQNKSFDMVITNEVTYIGIYLLSNFQGKVYMESTTPPTLGTPVGTIKSNMQMIVPVGSLSAYQTAYGSYITNIVEGSCPYPTR